ncbi:prolyl oligopeptidase family serine peptidase [uncultured Chryseobacterium sp.]|uniref:alpha/beta hydrolase family protein n=1 Tax=uncultured Chryseobacterium sp. TaxID=259322 RepID=UPI0025F363B1|nr:prolyl oligopeptidase family serine peptidase [uncultured Chryseobacterium sp.]
MKKILHFIFLFFLIFSGGQQENVKKLKINYKNTVANCIILSKQGDQEKKKPLLFFCQGSMARPLKIIADDASYPLLPFDSNILLEKYHIVMVSKPGIPLEENIKNLKEDYTYPKEGLPPKEYILNNNLDYYYKRNNFVLKELYKQPWADPEKTVAAGHSEGSYIALEMAVHNKKISHLIYSGGNPLGRMMSIIHQTRQNPKEEEIWHTENLDFWRETVANKDKTAYDKENTSYYNYSLSQDFTNDLLRLKIPVLVTYGTKDQNGIFNDYLNVLTIKGGKNNFIFKSYFNCDHNFFPVDKNLKPNYDVDNWNEVAKFWSRWLQ